MRPSVLALVRDFCAVERLKLRRYLVDRMRCELDLSSAEAEREIAAMEEAGWIRPVEISHYDPAIEDITAEPAVVPGRRLGDVDGLLIAG